MSLNRFLSLWIFLLSLTLGALSRPNLAQALNVQSVLLTNSSNSTINSEFSENWSGYISTNGTFTGVSGSWTIPQIIDNTPGADATWVGIGGVNSQDLIQAGTQATVGRSGRVSYEAFYETLPNISHPLNIQVNPGDSVSVSVNQPSTNNWVISIKDNTTGESTQINQTYASSLSSVEWIEEAPSTLRSIYPLDNFGMINFTNATAIENGQSVGIAQTSPQPVTMANQFREALATPSDIGNDGASFSVERTNVADSSPRYGNRRYSRGFNRLSGEGNRFGITTTGSSRVFIIRFGY